MINIKSRSEIKKIKISCKIAAEILYELSTLLKPGIKTRKLEEVAEELFKKKGCKSAFKGYYGYPASICVSPNDIVVHGIPGEYQVKEGDIISIDIGVEKDGYYGDVAATFSVGDVSAEAERLMQVTKESLLRGIEFARAGNRLHDISHSIQTYVESNGFSVVREFVGHGIGTEMHEDPPIPNFGIPNTGLLLKPGMTLAIEPMVNVGSYEVVIDTDGWTARTEDGSLSAHFEHTVLITDGEPEILTLL